MASEQTNSVALSQNTDLASTFAPPPLRVGSAADDAGDILGSIAHGGVTDDRQPEFGGRGTPGDTIVIRDNGTEIGTTEVDANGSWTFTPSTDLLEGQHAITIVTRDDSGNEGTPSPAFNFEIDVTPPDASRLNVSGFTDNAGGVTGNVSSGGTTDETRPLLSGISNGTPGHTVTVMVKDATGTHELGLATIGENGQWTFQVEAPLAAGLNTFMLVERDAAGNETMPTGRYKVTVNTDKPNAPVIVSVFDDVGEAHMLQQGEATNDARPTLAGTAQANHTVKFYDGSTLLGQVVTDASGQWSFTPPANLADGAHGITATSTSPVGQTSDASSVWSFVVDTTAPTQTATVTDIGKDSGFDADDYLTNDGSAGRLMMGQLSAPLAAGDTLQVSTDGGATWKEAFVSGSQWSAQDDSSHVGNWTVQTRVVDAAGNAGSVESQAMKLDLVAPAAPTSVTVVNGGLEIKFNSADVAVGHKLSLIVRGDHLDYALTAADIAAGKAFVADPSPLTQIDFEGPIDFKPVPSITFGELTVSTPTNMFVTDRSSGVHGVEGACLWVGVNSHHSLSTYKFSTPKEFLSFTLGGHNGVGAIKFFDKLGKEIGGLPVLNTSSPSIPSEDAYQKITFQAPAGFEIDHFVITSEYDGGGMVIDQMKFGKAPLDQFEISVAIVDQAGNTSQYVDTSGPKEPGLPQTLTEASAGTLHGGSDNNEFTVTDVKHLADSAIAGNGGTDTLKLTGANQLLDLTALAGKVSSVEVIDLTGTGNNTLKLSLADVMNNGAINQFVADGRVQMMVKGNAGDAVTLSDVLPNGTDPGDWVKGANVTIDGVVYEVYQHSGFDAELLVQQGVTITLQNAGAGTFHIEPEVEAYVLDHATQAYTESDDTIIAKLGFADRLEGGAGNDTFTHVGTGDVVHGGAGDDTIRINSGDFERVEGGLGIDTLVMDGKAMHIDLTAFGLKIQGFEKFDLGAGGNTLALHASDVLAGGMRDMVTADGKVQMLVNGANGDVNLLGGNDSWTQGGNTTVGDVTYSVYTNLAGTAELLVEDKVHVTIL